TNCPAQIFLPVLPPPLLPQELQRYDPLDIMLQPFVPGALAGPAPYRLAEGLLFHARSTEYLPWSAVWTSPDAQHPLIFDILSGRGGLNHGWVTKDVGWRSLAERFGLNLLTQECYRVLAGGTPSSIAPLG